MYLGMKLALGMWALGLIVVPLVLRYALRLKTRIAAAQSWPSARATITRAEVRSVGKSAWVPGIVYSYTVGGRAYDGHRLHFGAKTGTRAFAREIAEAHPVGMETQAFYDPDKPGFAALKVDGDPKAYLQGAGLFALMFIFVGVFFLFIG
jgi:hypothetical protein